MLAGKLKHLDFIQSVINRMSSYPFLLKGWSITLIVVLFTLTGDLSFDYISIVIFLCPIFIFWILDGYYLSKERQYRALYDHVRILDESDIDFSMSTEIFTDCKYTWQASIFSKTLIIFYVLLTMITAIILYLIS